MKFEETTLPKDALVEEAFNYANENNKATAPELTAQITQQIELQHQQQLLMLDAKKDAGQMSDDEFNLSKSRLDLQVKMQLRQVPLIVQQEIDFRLREKVLGPALELQNHSEASSPEMLAAALLLSAGRDPVDHDHIAAKFGEAVSKPLKQVLHLKAHPAAEEQKANLAAATDDEKRLYKADMTMGLITLSEQAKQMQMMFLPKEEETIFRPIKQLWGQDSKQDLRLADVFNKIAGVMHSPYRVEINETSGAPELVKNAQNTPSKPPGPKKPSGPPIKGDDGF
jgi:hypothetical protein